MDQVKREIIKKATKSSAKGTPPSSFTPTGSQYSSATLGIYRSGPWSDSLATTQVKPPKQPLKASGFGQGGPGKYAGKGGAFSALSKLAKYNGRGGDLDATERNSNKQQQINVPVGSAKRIRGSGRYNPAVKSPKSSMVTRSYPSSTQNLPHPRSQKDTFNAMPRILKAGASMTPIPSNTFKFKNRTPDSLTTQGYAKSK